MSRIERVQELIRREIATVLLQKMDRSRFGFISITEVKTSKNLKTARVYYSQIGSEEDKKRTHRHLIAAAGYIKGEVGKNIQLRSMPNLLFFYDEKLDKATELVNKINKLKHD